MGLRIWLRDWLNAPSAAESAAEIAFQNSAVAVLKAQARAFSNLSTRRVADLVAEEIGGIEASNAIGDHLICAFEGPVFNLTTPLWEALLAKRQSLGRMLTSAETLDVVREVGDPRVLSASHKESTAVGVDFGDLLPGELGDAA